MAHHIYTTPAFILESWPGKEADKFCALFTEELGLIRASAKGVRLQKSKLRYSLQDLSFSVVSVVRGKEFWRITNARQIDGLYDRYSGDKSIVYSIARIFRLLSRLIPEEEKNPELFADLNAAFDFLSAAAEEHSFSRSEILAFEYIVVLHILERLGYLEKVATLERFVRAEWSLELLAELEAHKKQAIEAINVSIRNSHL
jgi:DNA repair protein RecO